MSNGKRQKWKDNKIFYILLGFGIFIFILFLPLIIDFSVSHNKISTSYGGSDWFAFWGSYSGSIISAIITCFALYITIQYNNRQIKAALKEIEIREKYKEKFKVAEYAYKVITLKNYYPCDIDNITYRYEDHILHDLKELKYRIENSEECIYFKLTNKIIEQYINKITVFKEQIFIATVLKETIDSMWINFESMREDIEDSYKEYKENLEKQINNEIRINYNIN